MGNVFKVSYKNTVLRFLCNMEYHTTAIRSQLLIKKALVDNGFFRRKSGQEHSETVSGCAEWWGLVY